MYLAKKKEASPDMRPVTGRGFYMRGFFSFFKIKITVLDNFLSTGAVLIANFTAYKKETHPKCKSLFFSERIHKA